MKIIEEYIVMNANGDFCRFMLTENGLYFEQMPMAVKYEEKTKEYFDECVLRMGN